MLEIQDLTRRFGEHVAVDRVGFSVGEGLMTGFVGGNGAGKTTTMRMIMGVLQPTSGQVLWRGHEATPADRRTFGYMPEERGLYPKQPLLDQLVYLGRLQGCTKAFARTEAQRLLERFGLAARAKDKLEELSLGNQQRVQIAAAVIAEPDLLVLDEPFSGLDPAAVDSMAELLREQTARGVPVLFSSHQLELVERLCDRLAILSAGQLVGWGTVEDLRRRGPVRHRLRLAGDAAWVRELPDVRVVEIDGGEAILELSEAARAGDIGAGDALLREALQRDSVLEFSEIVPNLSEVYREVSE